MKIIHTGDWHIGKLVHGIHMTGDQKHILRELIGLIQAQNPDVLIIAGDVYDRSVPPIEAVELLDETLTEIIVKHGVKVMAIAGNHDSPDRVGFASKLLQDQGLFISGHIQQHIEPITLEDDEGLIDFYLVPYAEPSIVRELYGSEDAQVTKRDEEPGTDDSDRNPIKTHDDAMKVIMENIESRMDRSRRNVCITHCYLSGTDSETPSDSVRPLSIGGTETVNVDYFRAFDYVALGHLHRPQRVKEDHIRYSGSLLKYSFSEAIQKKSVPVVNLGCNGADIELHELKPIRDMRIIRGHLAELTDTAVSGLANTDDYIMAVLADKGELIDPFAALRSVYPNLLSVDRETYDREAGDEKSVAGQNFREKNPMELFTEFYQDISGNELTEDKATIVTEVMDTLIQKGRLRG